MLWLGRREAPHRSMRGAAAGAAVREKFGWPRREVQIRDSLEGRAAPARAEACSVGVEAGEAPYGGEGAADARSGGEGAANARSGGEGAADARSGEVGAASSSPGSARGGVDLAGRRAERRRPRREARGAAGRRRERARRTGCGGGVRGGGD